MTTAALPGVVVLVSGRGSNFQALLDAGLPVRFDAVISNRPGAYALERARRAGIDAVVIDHKRYDDRHSFDRTLAETIDRYQPRLIVLAGFMRLLTPEFVNRYQGRMINIHPSLLPKYRGLDTHARAIAAGDKEHGVSVHFVTAELDAGPVIVQARIPVLPGDTPETLAERVLVEEHRIYPLAVQWIATGRLTLRDDRVYFDDRPVSQPLQP